MEPTSVKPQIHVSHIPSPSSTSGSGNSVESELNFGVSKLHIQQQHNSPKLSQGTQRLKPLSPHIAKKGQRRSPSAPLTSLRSPSNSSTNLNRNQSYDLNHFTAEFKKTSNTLRTHLTLLCLLKNFLNQDFGLSSESVKHAKDKTIEFLEANKNSKISKEDFIELEKTLKKNPRLALILFEKTPLETLKEIHKQSIKQYRINLKHIIPTPNRLDKKVTGFYHTLIQTPTGKLNELLKTYDLNNKYDMNAIGQTHGTLLVPQGFSKLKNAEESQSVFSSVLGKGGHAIAILARDLQTGELIACKKSGDHDEINKEVKASQFVESRSENNEAQDFNLISHSAQSFGSKVYKDTLEPVPKSYAFSQLAKTSNEFTKLQENYTFITKDIKEFEKRNFAQVLLGAKLVLRLERMNLVHPDFKFENIFGHKIGDIGDLIQELDKLPENSFTPQYTMPNISSNKQLSTTEFKTFMRFNLGAALIIAITGKVAADPSIPSELRLASENNAFSNGFLTSTIDEVPKTLFNRDLTPYQTGVLKLAKKLMADDRTLVLPSSFDLSQAVTSLSQYLEQTQLPDGFNRSKSLI